MISNLFTIGLILIVIQFLIPNKKSELSKTIRLFILVIALIFLELALLLASK